MNELRIDSIAAVTAGSNAAGYVTDRSIATAIFLALELRKPIVVEGPAGVGKTELAKFAATFFGLPLVRLPCYDGLDEAKARYEWKYGKQLLYTQILRKHARRSDRAPPCDRRRILRTGVSRGAAALARIARTQRRGLTDR